MEGVSLLVVSKKAGTYTPGRPPSASEEREQHLPVDGAAAAVRKGKTDDAADDGVGGGDGELQVGGQEEPDHCAGLGGEHAFGGGSGGGDTQGWGWGGGRGLKGVGVGVRLVSMSSDASKDLGVAGGAERPWGRSAARGKAAKSPIWAERTRQGRRQTGSPYMKTAGVAAKVEVLAMLPEIVRVTLPPSSMAPGGCAGSSR